MRLEQEFSRLPHSPVLRSNVGPLPVQGGGVVHLEEDLQQVGGRDLGRVVLEVDGLGVARVARADLLPEKTRQDGSG